MDVLKKVPVREQDAKERATNFDEVCLGYNKEEAMCEASRCINCKNAQCVKGCPVAIDIPGFINEVKNGNIEAAYRIISQSSALPAVCGRVCPQQSCRSADVSSPRQSSQRVHRIQVRPHRQTSPCRQLSHGTHHTYRYRLP